MQESHLPTVPRAEPAAASEMLAAGSRMIDVREPEEWAVERIPGAELMPMSNIGDWWTGLDPDEPIVVQCHTGARSAMVVHALREQAGFTNVVNLAGGIEAWAASGLPVDTQPREPSEPSG